MSNPIDFSCQGALRRMLRMEIVPFVADQSAVRILIERCYAPAETDIAGCRSFGSRSELLTLVRRRVRDAISERAVNCEFELLEDYTWLRLDFQGASKHEVYRHTAPCLPDPAAESGEPGTARLCRHSLGSRVGSCPLSWARIAVLLRASEGPATGGRLKRVVSTAKTSQHVEWHGYCIEIWIVTEASLIQADRKADSEQRIVYGVFRDCGPR